MGRIIILIMLLQMDYIPAGFNLIGQILQFSGSN